MTGFIIKTGIFSIPHALNTPAAASTRPLMKEKEGIMMMSPLAGARAILFSASGILHMMLRLAVVRTLEEAGIRQAVAELAVVCGNACLLDDDRAQKNYQLGFLSFVIAVHEQISHSGD